ncbi:MAG: tetratricopeptide repeat protein [Candidatus Marinimicrobia bacterium]|nr:tetratricopeptide repeat protein [Candidatus Neomarinimicrobiota bacterium]
MNKKIKIILWVIIFVSGASSKNPTGNYLEKVKQYHEMAKTFIYRDNDSLFYYTDLAIQTGKESGDPQVEIDAMYLVAFDFSKAGFYDTTKVLLERALKMSEEQMDIERTAKIKNQLGHILWLKSDNVTAKRYFEDAIEIFKKVGNQEELGKALNNLAYFYTKWGEYKKAIDLYVQALDAFVASDFIEGAAWLNFSMGVLFQNVGEYEQALNYIQNSLKMYGQIARLNQDSTGVRMCYNQMGYIYTHHLDSLELGLEYQLKALKLAEKTNLKIVFADALAGIGETYYKMGKLNEARDNIQRAYDYRVLSDIKSGTASNLKFLGYIERDKKNYSEAEKYFLQANELAKKLNSRSNINDLNFAFSGLYEEQKQYRKALSYLKKYNELRDSILSNEIANTVVSANLKHEIEKKIRENDLLAQQNKIQQLQIERVRLMRNYLLIVVLLALFTISITIFMYFKQKQIKTLRGLIPICAKCKRIRNDEGYYEKLEVYIAQHTEAGFSYGLCPDCLKTINPQHNHEIKDADR